MSRQATDDELVVVAIKWLGVCAAFTVVVAALVWFEMSNTAPRSSGGRSSGARLADTDPDSDAEDRFSSDPERPSSRRPPPPHGPQKIPGMLGGGSEQDSNSPGADADADADAEKRNEEIDEHDNNIQTFENRLEQLEAELADGRAAPERQSALATQLEAALRKSTRLPSQVKARCSEGVCEISLAGEGTAFDFAVTSAEMLLSVTKKAARGQADDGFVESFDPAQALQPALKGADGAPVADAGQGDGQQQDAPSSESAPTQSVRSIRYMIDVKDLGKLLEPDTYMEEP